MSRYLWIECQVCGENKEDRDFFDKHTCTNCHLKAVHPESCQIGPPKVEIKISPLTRLQEYEAEVSRIKAVWGPARVLDELEAAVTVVVAQKYEAIIEQRVRDALGVREARAARNAGLDAGAAVEARFERAIEKMKMHLECADYGLCKNAVDEILADLRAPP